MKRARTRKTFALAACTAGLLAGLPAATASADRGDRAVDFSITRGQVVPGEDFAAKITVIGCSWGTASGQLGAITVQVHVGDETIEPFGAAIIDPYGSSSSRRSGRRSRRGGSSTPSLPTTGGNVNTGSISPIHMIIDQMFDPDAAITMTARAWEANASVSRTPYVLNSSSDLGAVMVLRDGDDVPTFSTMSNQTNVEAYLNPYTNEAGSHMALHPNQAIYLFEFNNLSGSFGIDYQDLVVMVTLGESVEDLEEDLPPLSDLGTAYD